MSRCDAEVTVEVLRGTSRERDQSRGGGSLSRIGELRRRMAIGRGV
jgi:hypothetical protein